MRSGRQLGKIGLGERQVAFQPALFDPGVTPIDEERAQFQAFEGEPGKAARDQPHSGLNLDLAVSSADADDERIARCLDRSPKLLREDVEDTAHAERFGQIPDQMLVRPIGVDFRQGVEIHVLEMIDLRRDPRIMVLSTARGLIHGVILFQLNRPETDHVVGGRPVRLPWPAQSESRPGWRSMGPSHG